MTVRRVPPHAEFAEQAILGCALLARNDYPLMMRELDTHDFYVFKHQIIWAVMQDLSEGGRHPEPQAVLDTLGHAGKLDRVGGEEYLAHLARAVMSPSGWMEYVEDVRAASSRRKVIQICQEAESRAYSTQTPSDMVNEITADLAEAIVHGQRHITVNDIVKSVMDSMDPHKGSTDTTTSLGFPSIDHNIGGCPHGAVWVLAGRPGTGKTAFALNAALNALRDGIPVLCFSLEMAALSIYRRLFSTMTAIPYNVLLGRQLASEEEIASVLAATKEPLWSKFRLFDNADITPQDIRAEVIKTKSLFGRAPLVIIDYLQLLDVPMKRTRSREQEIAYISRSLAKMAVSENVPVLAVCQMNRAVEAREDHRPRLSDLRESGALENDASLVAFLSKPSDWDRAAPHDLIHFVVRKNRHGMTMDVPLKWEPDIQRYGNYNCEDGFDDAPPVAVVDGFGRASGDYD